MPWHFRSCCGFSTPQSRNVWFAFLCGRASLNIFNEKHDYCILCCGSPPVYGVWTQQNMHEIMPLMKGETACWLKTAESPQHVLSDILGERFISLLRPWTKLGESSSIQSSWRQVLAAPTVWYRAGGNQPRTSTWKGIFIISAMEFWRPHVDERIIR